MSPPALDRWRYARRYLAVGWRLVPNYPVLDGICACPAGSACPSPGKHPLLRAWPRAASRDPAVVRAWLARWPDANLGLATGQGLLVLDLDLRQGATHWPAAQRRLLPPTVAQISGSGGRHLFYRVPAGLRIKTTAQGQLAPGVDTRGDGGQVILAPSRNRHGPYVWVPGHAPWEREPTLLTPALRTLLERRGVLVPRAAAVPTRPCAPLPCAGPRPAPATLLERYLIRAYPGCRNRCGFLLALQLRDHGYAPDEAAAVLRAYQRQVDDPAHPYSWAEAAASLAQAYRYPPRRPWAASR